jgi:flagellar hook-basal body complex protein FliE
MSAPALNSLAQQMKVMTDMAAGNLNAAAPVAPVGDGVDFQSILTQAVREVNQAQNSAQAKVQQFSTGESSMTLEEVMVSLQKANLSLQGMIAVRNRLVEAYKDITNLPV